MIVTSMSQWHSTEYVPGFAIRFFVGHDCLQVFSQSGGVLRGFTQLPPLNHASSMANGAPRRPTFHLRAYRFGTGGMLLHLVLEGE